jgi:hypothetical protein
MHALRLLAVLGLAGAAAAQTTFPEAEPNGTRALSTFVNGLAANDSITGASTGTSTTSGSTLLSTLDMYRVKTGALPLGIYRHTLTITSAPTGHTGTIRGLTQTGGVIGTTDVAWQTSSTLTTPPRSNTWYGFGKQEELYYSVTGTGSTTAAYACTLSTQPVTPLVVPGSFLPGNVTVTTFAQGHTTDTEIYVYDGNLSPVPLGHNDDLLGGTASSSTVTISLAAGTYYVAISNYNTANNQSDQNPTEEWKDGPVLDFPNVVANGNLTTAVNVAFSVSDTLTTAPLAATKVNAFDIVWARFVVSPASTPTTSFCFGTNTACPCANAGAAGNGCANALFPSGAVLSASGIAGTSPGTDTLVFTATNMTGPALLFQGTAQQGGGTGVAFGDGLMCAGGVIVRLGVVITDGSSATWPGGSNPNPIYVTGGSVSGDVRHFQGWYRDAAPFCTTATYNLTQGLTLTFVP